MIYFNSGQVLLVAVKMENNKTLHLSYLFCYFLDPPNGHWNDSECSGSNPGMEYCIQCPVNSSFQLGGTVEDRSSTGHKVSICLWMLTLAFGLLGTIANTLIIIILKKHHCTKSFEILLCALACFDMICSVMTIFSSTGIITYLENWNRGSITLKWIYITYFTTVLGRTGSTFMKVLITAERYIFIAHPEASGKWLSKTKTKLLALAVLGFSVILNLPRYLSAKVIDIDNEPYRNIYRIKKLNVSCVLKEQMQFANWKELSVQFDSWAPFPLLLLFSFLIFREIKKINSKKRALQVTRKKDIREVQMFVPVIIVLFICNIFPVVHFMIMKYTRTIYREHVFGMLLFVALNSAVNLPIYICGGTTFRKEARGLLYKVTNRIG